MRLIDRLILVAIGTVLLLPVGCLGPQPTLKPLPPLPRATAEGIVNANALLVAGTLRAMGSVDGTVRDRDGTLRSFSLDGILFYLHPSYLRFDLKKFGDRQVLLGSNAEKFWVYSNQEDVFRCAQHGSDEDFPLEFPISPRQLLDALGLGPITDSFSEGSIGRVQRVESETQQILFLRRNDKGDVVVEKEYWLHRSRPRLISRVLFRDGNGNLEMDSRLSEYRKLDETGPLLPHKMEASWGDADASLTFTIEKWSVYPEVLPTGPQFATPEACGLSGT